MDDKATSHRPSRRGTAGGPSGPARQPFLIQPSNPSVRGNQNKPQRRLGQHFLKDPNLIDKIIRAADIRMGDVVLEIGPGRGHLTRALLGAGARVIAVEIDRELAAGLKEEFRDNPSLRVMEGDFMAITPEEWLELAHLAGVDYKVVANLPYYITSAILRHLLEARHQPTVLVVMVQKEVAQEITAQPNRMSLLAVSVQFYGQPQIISIVPAGAFYPRPKVDSAIVRILVDRPSRFGGIDSHRFFEIVRAGFGERRKQIHNALARGLKMKGEQVREKLVRAGIDPLRRAETLSLEEWGLIYRQFI